MEYTWKIDHISVKNAGDLKDAVYRVHWFKMGTDEEGNTGRFYGATEFDHSTLDPDAFVPFDEITEELMISWIQSKITPELDDHYNNLIAKDLEGRKNPERAVMAPWVTAPLPAQTNSPE